MGLACGCWLAATGALPAAALPEGTDAFVKQNSSSSTALTDGVYFFGQAREPGAIGREYLVFEVRNGRVSGAVYAPQSEYSCFTGTVTDGVLALNIVDTYDNQVYPYAIALESRNTLTAGQGQPVAGLVGYHRIERLRELEYQLLDACGTQ